MMAGNLMQQFYNIADTLIVGRVVGKNALAAVEPAYTLMTFLTSIFWDFPWGQESYFPFIKGKTISMRAGSCGACFCADHGSDGLR